MALLLQRNALELGQPALPWFRKVLAQPGFRLAPLEPEIAVASVTLDWAHRDPADRMIVATARHHGLPLVTADREILAFGAVEALDARR